VFAYRKEHEKEAIWAKELGKTFQLTDVGDLNIHIIGDRTKRLISLSPAAHIDKVVNRDRQSRKDATDDFER
jgi:hypothetical protein